MAQIQLSTDRINDPNLWPNQCLRCNKPATGSVPIPKKYAVEGVDLSVPLCDEHRHHWQAFQKTNLVGIFVILNFLILFPILLWNLLGPVQGGPNAEGERIAILVVSTAGGAILLGLLMLFWVGGPPIKINDVTGFTLTLSGVSREFAHWWAEQESNKSNFSAPEPEVPRFDVKPWRPDGVSPYPGVVYLFLWPVLLGGLLGVILGLSMLWLTEVTANWDSNDLRYLLLIALVIAVYSMVVGILLRPSLGLWVFLGVIVAIFIAFILGCSGIAAWLRLFPLSSSLTGVLFIPALIILMVVLYRLVAINRVRHILAAGIAGFLGPAVLIGTLVLVLGGRPGVLGGWLAIGILLVLCTIMLAAEKARSPFCTQCDTWMQKESLGGLHVTSPDMQSILSQGEILRLLGEKFKEKALEGETELAVFHCPNCKDTGLVVLELTDFQKNAKGNATRRKVGQWAYPGSVLTVLRELK